MRITPMAVWGSQLSNEDLYKAVHLQTYFTHSNKVAIDSAYLYCLAIKMILNGVNDGQYVYSEIKKEAKRLNMKTITEWFKELDRHELPIATSKIGWLKIAFLYSFYYLKQNSDYEFALRDILLKGGDTDTNAAIVCGMIGALYNKEDLNQEYVNKVM